jgi:beta-lactamase regulating signal transducer with metallopeptidase domain/Tol biopolymer transport system component
MVEIINDCLSGLNHLGKGFCVYAVGAFLQSAVLVIVLFAIDLLLRKRVRAVFRYCIWLLVLVKLILPPTLSLPTGIGYWVGDRLPAGSVVSEGFADVGRFEAEGRGLPARPQPSDTVARVQPAATAVETDAVAPPVAVTLTPITWQAILLLFWLAGMLAFAALLAQRVRFVRGLVAASTAAEGQLLELLEACRRQIGVRRRVGLRTSDALPSPAVCGLWRPTILMPASLVTKLSPGGLKAALIHELAHIKRADLWVNSVQTFLQVVHFYNPFVWFANAIIRRTCEEAVDETVLVTLSARARDYSNTLIDIGEMAFWKADFGLRLVGVAESKKALQWRIKHMLTRPVPTNARIGVLGTIIILIVAAVLLPMARGERSNPGASAAPGPAVAGTTTTAPAVKEGDTLVDPNTGVKFTLARTFSGANNVIEHRNKLTLSPDGRFLLWWGRVVPVDGTDAFRYTEDDAREVAVSPNGRYIAYGEKAVWLQPVSPETLRPNGPSRKLVDLKGGQLVQTWGRPTAIRWTPDSETVFFQAQDADGKPQQYAFSAATGAPVSFPDAMARGLRSPDGKCVALIDGTNVGFWVKDDAAGAARLLCGEGPGPLCWSADGRWLIGVLPDRRGVRFARYPEGQEYQVRLPGDLADSSLCVGTSADKSKLFFYQPGYDLKFRIKVASATDGAVKDVDVRPPYEYFEDFQWAPDGKTLLIAPFSEKGGRGLVASPLSGQEPVEFAVKPDGSAEAVPSCVSPDGKWLLFAGTNQPGTRTLSVAPLSLAGHQVSGPATAIFRDTLRSRGPFILVWSPDSTRVALISADNASEEKGIWIAFADGKPALRLTRTVADERDLKWSPDAGMLAFVSESEGAGELKVVPTAGGDATVIRKWDNADEQPTWGWSPDGKSLTMTEGDMLVRQPVSGGKAEPIANLKESGVEWASWLSWSPDGSRLGLVCNKPGNKDLRVWGQVVFARVEQGRLQRTAAADQKGGNWYYTWSPDSTYVAYTCEDAVPVRPDGRLFALAMGDVLERIDAGAIPVFQPKAATRPETATQPKTDANTAAVAPPESKPAAPPEPVPGPVFTDDFDEGPSTRWTFFDMKDQGRPEGAHAVENGQMMLSNCKMGLTGLDWADYAVKVRVCIKDSADTGEATFGIEPRYTPSSFGLKTQDYYAFNIVCVNNSPLLLWLGVVYWDPSRTTVPTPAPFGRRSSPTLARDQWYTMEFEVRAQQLRASLDGKLVLEATDARLSKGPVWLTAWKCHVLVDDFSVRQLP